MLASILRFGLLSAPLLLALSGAASAAENRSYGRYGHDIVPFVPDANGYVVVAPSGPGPWNMPRQKHRERPYDDGLYDSHGGWQMQWSYAPRYPYGWFGAQRNTTHTRTLGPTRTRNEWQIR
jgi:hypothetical protein